MPRTGFKTVHGVQIILDQLNSTFAPGDTITGQVCVPIPSNGQQNVIRLKLWGRSKTRILRSNGQTRSVYRGRGVLFNETAELNTPTSFQGNQEVWGFNMRIPSTVQPIRIGADDHDEWKKTGLYKSNHKRDVTEDPLPGVFNLKESGLFAKGESYVEYVLQVSCQQSQDFGKAKWTTIPLIIRNPSTAIPVSWSEEEKLTSMPPCVIKSMKVLPEYADQEMGFGHSMKKVFRSSKLPKYTFRINVTYPKTIQLDHPEPLPLKLSVIPDFNLSNCYEQHDLSTIPPVKLESFNLYLKSEAEMKAKAWPSETETDFKHEYQLLRTLPFGHGDLVIPIDNSAPNLNDPNDFNGYSKQSSNQPQERELDLGSICTIRPSRTHTDTAFMKIPYAKDTPLWPSFNTYNLYLRYYLCWKFTVECAGETERYSKEVPCVVLGASDETVRLQEMDPEKKKTGYAEYLEGIALGVEIASGILEVVAAFSEM